METISKEAFINSMNRDGWKLKGNFPNQWLIKESYRINLYARSFKLNLCGVIRELEYTENNATNLRVAFLFINDFVEYERAVS